jgi:endonuclease/exonuclease/phosphatase family metal-dependent hydrolase
VADARAARRDIEDVTGPGFKIVSWNLLHRDGATADDINAMIARERPDLLLLQEATAATSTFLADAGGFYVTNAVPGSVHHLGAWSRLPLRQSPASLALQPGIVVRRRCQVIAFDEFSIANVHLSHGQMLNRRQLRRIAANLPRCAAIMGDCNLIGPAMLPGFRDVGPRQPTHKAGAFVPLRLDRCFVRAMKCDEAIALERGTSDHRPIAVRLSAVAPE